MSLRARGEVHLPVGFTDVGENQGPPFSPLYIATLCTVANICGSKHRVPGFQNTTQSLAENPKPLWMRAAML